MDPDPRLDDLVAPLRADVVSGASEVARAAADVVRRAAVRLQAGSLEELRWGMGSVCTRLLDAQPSMAPLVALVRDVLTALEASSSVEEGRLAAANAAEGFRAGLEARSAAVAEHAARLLPTQGTIATISASGTVKAALLRAAAERPVRVLCFESRPMNEGRSLAQALARGGISVTYAVDAAAWSLVGSCAAVLLGADSIGDRGVVNKIGSASLARAASDSSVPVYVAADETKILPPGFPQPVDDDRPQKEVWEGGDGVRAWNRYFEVVPIEWVTAVVTEEGEVTPSELEAMRGGIELPEGLRGWAERRGG